MSTDGRDQPYPEPTGNSADALRDATAGPRRWVEEDGPSPEQIEIYRRMTPGRRLEVAEQLYWSARKLKTAGVRIQHPDWPEEKVLAEVNRIFLHARS